MRQNLEELFGIVRIAIGTDTGVFKHDWMDLGGLFQSSLEQGVVNIACDGLQRLLTSEHLVAENININCNEDLWYKWIGYGLTSEIKYNNYTKTISELATLFNNNGYKFYLLKGYGLSLYYPIASHRTIGDIDFYLMKDRDRIHEFADVLVQKCYGIPVLKSKMEHHSHFTFRGFTVEHHYQFTTTYRRQTYVQDMDDLLKSLINVDYQKRELNGIELLLPSPTFNAIYLMWHMATHFCELHMSVKQLCDWALFVNAEKDNVDWAYVDKVYGEYHLKKFASVVNSIIRGRLNVDIPLRQRVAPSELEDKILNDMFCEQRDGLLLSRMAKYPKSEWKYNLLQKPHWYHALFDSVLLHTILKKDTEKKLVEIK